MNERPYIAQMFRYTMPIKPKSHNEMRGGVTKWYQYLCGKALSKMRKPPHQGHGQGGINTVTCFLECGHLKLIDGQLQCDINVQVSRDGL